MIHGILNIRKEKQFTSHDVVAKLRGILRQKKIGHTGTLDPDATGVLPVCLGKATKLCSMIDGWEKTYEAVLLLGVETDTEDTGGTILTKKEVSVSPEEAERIILGFQGEYLQVPPMYSAKKVHGKKLYELAREGITIEREPCPVTIKDISVKEICLPRIRFLVTCSKGTYIRSLCRDIGRACGCGGCMEELVRTRVEMFSIEEALTLGEIEKLRDEDRILQVVVPVDRMFEDLPSVTVNEEGEKRLYNGNPLPLSVCSTDHVEGEVRIYDRKGQFIGIYSEKPGKILKPLRLFL